MGRKSSDAQQGCTCDGKGEMYFLLLPNYNGAGTLPSLSPDTFPLPAAFADLTSQLSAVPGRCYYSSLEAWPKPEFLSSLLFPKVWENRVLWLSVTAPGASNTQGGEILSFT